MRKAKKKSATPLRAGKKNHQGEGGGGEKSYSSESELNVAITLYFEVCDRKKERPSKAGLRAWLDIAKSTYSNYKKRFVNPIRKAEALIEAAWVSRLSGASATGAIFYLKNAFRDEYQDRIENDITSKGEKISALASIQVETRKILEADKPEKK